MKQAVLIKITQRDARKAHRCYTCGGEFPINPGGTYWRWVVKDDEGKVQSLAICPRCQSLTVQRHKAGARFAKIEKNSMTWDKVPNCFRKKWLDYIQVCADFHNGGKALREALTPKIRELNEEMFDDRRRKND